MYIKNTPSSKKMCFHSSFDVQFSNFAYVIAKIIDTIIKVHITITGIA